MSPTFVYPFLNTTRVLKVVTQKSQINGYKVHG